MGGLRLPTAWMLCSVVAVGFGHGCRTADRVPSTQVVVEVRSDLRSGDEVASVEVQVRHPESDALVSSRTFRLGTPDQVAADGALTEFPFSFVVRRGAQDGFALRVVGRGPARDGTELRVEAFARARFSDGETVLLSVFLARACVGRACAEATTCEPSDAGSDPPACVPVRTQEGLPVIEPGEEQRAWGDDRIADAAIGIGVLDAGGADGAARGQRDANLPQRPDASTPDASAPDASAPDASVPDASVPVRPDASAVEPTNCGNGQLDADEVCDDGGLGATCRRDCSARRTPLAAADLTTCLALEGEGVRCWGRALGAPEGSTHTSATPVSGLPKTIHTVAVAKSFACAVDDAGRVWCWGADPDGVLGFGTESAPMTTSAKLVTVPGDPTAAVHVATGTAHACIITRAGAVRCWGEASSVLGTGGVSGAVAVPATVGAIDLSAGGNSSCAVTAVGDVLCWGGNSTGKLGDGTTTARSTPVTVLGLRKTAQSVSVGANAACAVLVDGGIRCWGQNEEGELGNGTRLPASSPTDVVGLPGDALDHALYAKHACALIATGDGSTCWGLNNSGQLGDGTRDRATMAGTSPALPSAPIALVVNSGGSCALLAPREVRCWGRDNLGQLGNGDETGPHTRPVRVLGIP